MGTNIQLFYCHLHFGTNTDIYPLSKVFDSILQQVY